MPHKSIYNFLTFFFISVNRSFDHFHLHPNDQKSTIFYHFQSLDYSGCPRSRKLKDDAENEVVRHFACLRSAVSVDPLVVQPFIETLDLFNVQGTKTNIKAVGETTSVSMNR
jgi:hypothetical protein